MTFFDALPVTILYGSLNALLALGLALHVSLHRVRGRVFVTDQQTPELHRKVRAHGNAVEYFAVTTFLLAFLELQRVPSFWLHVCGGLVLVARMVHSFGILTKSRITPFSAGTTYTVSFVMALWSLYLRLR